MKTRLTILFLSIELMAYGVTFTPVSTVSSKASVTNSGLYLPQVKVELPSKNATVAVVPIVVSSYSSNLQQNTLQDVAPFTVRVGVRTTKTSYGGFASGSLESLHITRGAGGMSRRLLGTRTTATARWTKKGWNSLGWFDDNYNYLPNNTGSLPQAPYFGTTVGSGSEDESTPFGYGQTVAPMTTTPIAFLLLFAFGYAYTIARRKRHVDTLKTE